MGATGMTGRTIASLRRALPALALGAGCSLLAWPLAAQQIFAYPARGQSPELQQRDMGECQAWAAKTTGFDPSRPPAVAAPPPSPVAAPPVGGVFRGAARGAIVGTVGGAIVGDTGRGAAVGAATGGLIGGMRRVDQARQQAYAAQTYQQQQGAAVAQGQAGYNRALGACLTGRGYSIS